MTPKQAILSIQDHNKAHQKKEPFAVYITEALQVACDVLEKQIPKKVIYESDGYYDGNPVYDVAYCPVCNIALEDGDIHWESNYCPNCGQRLDWEVEEDNEDAEIH